MKKWTGHTFDSARALGTNNSRKTKALNTKKITKKDVI